MRNWLAKWRGVLLGMYLPTLAMTVGMGMVSPSIPLLAINFGVSLGLASQIVTAGSVGRIIVLGPAGYAVDRIGTRRTMIVGGVLSVAGTLVASIAPGFVVLLLGLMLVGGGNSMWMLGREIAAVEMVSPAQRGRVLSSLFGVSVAGMAFGPIVGGVLIEHAGLRAVFGAYFVLSVAILSLSVLQREQPVAHRRRPAETVSGGLNWHMLSLIEPAFRVTFFVLFAATFGAMLRSAVLNSTLPIYASQQRSLSPTQVGSLFAIIGVANLLMIWPVGFLSDRWGRKAAIVPAAVFTAIAFVLLPLAQDVPQLTGVMVIMGIGSGLSLGSMTISTYDIVPDHHRGVFQSLRRGVGELGSLVGPALAGVLTDVFNPGATFVVLAPYYVVLAVLIIFVARETHPTRRKVALLGAGPAPA